MLKEIDKWVVELKKSVNEIRLEYDTPDGAAELKKSVNEIRFEFDTPDGAADFYEIVKDTIVDNVIVDCKVYARMKK